MEAAAKARVVEDARLPPPTTTIHSNSGGMPHFALLGRDKDKILTVGAASHYDTFGLAVLYDDGSRTFHVLPSPRSHKINPLWVAIGDGLYSMEDVRQPHGSGKTTRRHGDDDRYATTVDALVPHCHEDGDYSWRDFPPTPHERLDWKSELGAYAAVGGSSIWVSTGTGCHGTLALDTASGAWSKAGDWPLPFVGRGTEHGGLWFGFSGDTLLQAWDLRADGGPASRLRWGDMPGIVGGSAFESEVAVLGDGRLCVGRLFEVHPPPPWPTRRHCSCYYYRRRIMPPRERKRPPRVFAVLTGVEVVDDGDGRGFRLIEHKSCRYNLGVCTFARFGERKFVQLLF